MVGAGRWTAVSPPGTAVPRNPVPRAECGRWKSGRPQCGRKSGSLGMGSDGCHDVRSEGPADSREARHRSALPSPAASARSRVHGWDCLSRCSRRSRSGHSISQLVEYKRGQFITIRSHISFRLFQNPLWHHAGWFRQRRGHRMNHRNRNSFRSFRQHFERHRRILYTGRLSQSLRTGPGWLSR